MSEQQPRRDAPDGLADLSARDVLADRAPIARADEVRDRDAFRTAEHDEERADDSASAAEILRRNAETVRRTGENIRQVRDRLQSTADRVQALRDAARSLGDDIARTADAVEPPTPGPGVEGREP